MALSPTNHTLTQGSLHYRLATLGYQKQNPYEVRLSHELPLRPLFLLKWLSKAEGNGVCQFANILCAAFPIERDEIKKSATPTALCSMLRINPG